MGEAKCRAYGARSSPDGSPALPLASPFGCAGEGRECGFLYGKPHRVQCATAPRGSKVRAGLRLADGPPGLRPRGRGNVGIPKGFLSFPWPALECVFKERSYRKSRFSGTRYASRNLNDLIASALPTNRSESQQPQIRFGKTQEIAIGCAREVVSQACLKDFGVCAFRQQARPLGARRVAPPSSQSGPGCLIQ